MNMELPNENGLGIWISAKQGVFKKFIKIEDNKDIDRSIKLIVERLNKSITKYNLIFNG